MGSDSGCVLKVVLIGFAIGCGVGEKEKKESRINPRFLAEPTGRMELPHTERSRIWGG